MKTREIYIDEPDREVRIYFDTENQQRIHKLAYKFLNLEERDVFRKLLDKLSSESLILYADISGYFDYDDDEGDYSDGYEARVEEENCLQENFRYRHGLLIQKIQQMAYKYGSHKDDVLSESELKELLEVLEGECL